jgi:hypothetical protein
MSGHGYRYVGQGERYRGVPSRDLTQDEFEALGPLEQRTVTTSGGFEPMTAKDAKAAEADAQADAGTGEK